VGAVGEEGQALPPCELHLVKVGRGMRREATSLTASGSERRGY